MKICYIVPWFPSVNPTTPEASQGIFEFRYVKKLGDDGYQFKVFTMLWKGQSAYEKASDNVEVYRLPYRFLFKAIRYPLPDFFKLVDSVSRACREWNPDIVVFAHMIYLTSLPVFILKRRIRKPVIVTTDVFPGINWFFGSKVVDTVGHAYTLLVCKRLLNAADGIQLLVSGLDRHVRGLGVDASKAFVVNREVDINLFKPGGTKEKARAEFGIGKDDILLLFVGRLDRVKGLPYLIEAAKRVMREQENVKLLIVGHGSMTEECKAMAAGFEERIIFAGHRGDVPELMRASDIFVSPSISEGAANAVMEASASGLAVVATAVGEIPVIVQDSATGLLVQPKDTEGLYVAIKRLLGDPELYEAMGVAGRKRMEELYSWEVVRGQVDENYRRVVEKFARAGRGEAGPIVAQRAAGESERADAR